MNATELTAAFKLGQSSPLSAVRAALDRIECTKGYRAALNTFDAFAFRLAKASSQRYQEGNSLTPLDGVPFAVKANIALEGQAMSCGSFLLKNYISPYTATVVQRLLDAGAVPVASANMDEFAMGSTGENSAFGAAQNPFDPARVPGGSSSGSAVLTALKCVPFALGSDTGGSVRLPAAHCGVYGFKPTYGRLSRYGLASYASSLEQIGILADSPDVISAVFSIAQGMDAHDCTAIDSCAPLASVTQQRCKAAPMTQLIMQCGHEVRDAIFSWLEQAKSVFDIKGSVNLPAPQYIAPAYYVIACAEASANLARYDGIRYGSVADDGKPLLGDEVKKRIALGSYALSRDCYASCYERAMSVKRRLCRWAEDVFAQVDFLIAPVSFKTAPLMGEAAGDPVAFYSADLATVPANLAGLPALSIPCGFDRHGMPIGVQLIGKRLSDERLLFVAQKLLLEEK